MTLALTVSAFVTGVLVAKFPTVRKYVAMASVCILAVIGTITVAAMLLTG